MTSSIYSMIYYENGVSVGSYSTNSLKEAQKAFRNEVAVRGFGPRVFVDGERLSISRAEKLLGQTAKNAKKEKQRYVNNPAQKSRRTAWNACGGARMVPAGGAIQNKTV